MATDYQSATMAAQPHHYQPQHAYRKSNLYGQNNSGSNSPIDVSPTSTHTLSQMPAHNRHPQAIRALKTPGYIPAALRRTEKPGRQSPPNIDSGLESPPSGLNTSSPYYTNSPGDMTPVNRIATEDMHSIYDDTPLSPVAGPITRNHWQPDSSTAYCTASCCQQPFGLFNRRHHCRKCGGIFCYQHTQKQVRLNELALFHPEGDWQKSCDRCHTQYREWEQMRSSRTNSESSGSSTAAMQIDTPPSKGPENTRVGSLAQSLGGGWNWSTF